MVVACVFVFGATHFFLINAFVFIYMAYNPMHQPTVAFITVQKVFEYFEAIMPLVCGFFLIYIVFRMGFIDEEEDELAS